MMFVTRGMSVQKSVCHDTVDEPTVIVSYAQEFRGDRTDIYRQKTLSQVIQFKLLFRTHHSWLTCLRCGKATDAS